MDAQSTRSQAADLRMHATSLDPETDRVDANGRLGGTVGRLDRLYRLIDPFSTGSIPQKIDRLDRFSIDFRPQKALYDVFFFFLYFARDRPSFNCLLFKSAAKPNRLFSSENAIDCKNWDSTATCQ